MTFLCQLSLYTKCGSVWIEMRMHHTVFASELVLDDHPVTLSVILRPSTIGFLVRQNMISASAALPVLLPSSMDWLTMTRPSASADI